MSALFVVLILCANVWMCQQSQAENSTSLPAARFLSAMCQSRCLQEHDEIPSCMKPCLELKLHTVKSIKKCKKFCQDKATVSGAAACADSCSFLLKCLVTDKTSHSCSNGKTCGVPASPTALNVTDKNATLSVLSWSSPAAQPWAVGTIFIISSRSRPSQDSLFRSWIQIGQTTQLSLALSSLEEQASWHQFQVVAVNKFGASKPSQSAVVQLAISRPNPPRDFKVTSMKVTSKGTVNVEFSWKKPINLDVPVHRYRIYWSERLHQRDWTTELIGLRVHEARVTGKNHVFRRDELKPNQTYVFEIQAICRWRLKRLRSKIKYIKIVTPLKSDEPTSKFDGNQNTKRGPSGNKNSNGEAPIEGPSMLAIDADSANTTSGPSRTSSTNKTVAQPGLIATAMLLIMLFVGTVQC